MNSKTIFSPWVVISVFLICGVSSRAQAPVDLFSNRPKLGSGFVRIGAWNLRHLNLEGTAASVLPGNTRDEDFESLVSTFAMAISDLALDIAVLVEHQPRSGEPNRLLQLRDKLNSMTGEAWNADETQIPYDNNDSEFGSLQFGLLWKPSRATIDPTADTLLEQLRQPRGPNGQLLNRNMRCPWLIPVKVGNFEFDLMALHLKSGGAAPQAEEVSAIEGYVRARQTQPNLRHLIICGDWNIRPDQAQGRNRLKQMMVSNGSVNLMRVLTVERLALNVDHWATLGQIDDSRVIARLIPYSHFNAASLDTFLDHIAISTTLDEIFDHPIQVQLTTGAKDLQPGIEIAAPLIPETAYNALTDHLPIVLILRTESGTATPSGTTTPTPGASPRLRIVAAIPNPVGDDTQQESVEIKNLGTAAVSLTGWRIGDSTGTAFWLLNNSDGPAIAPNQTVTITRKGRNMNLNNSGDTIVLFDASGNEVDRRAYGQVASGEILTF